MVNWNSLVKISRAFLILENRTHILFHFFLFYYCESMRIWDNEGNGLKHKERTVLIIICVGKDGDSISHSSTHWRSRVCPWQKQWKPGGVKSSLVRSFVYTPLSFILSKVNAHIAYYAGKCRFIVKILSLFVWQSWRLSRWRSVWFFVPSCQEYFPDGPVCTSRHYIIHHRIVSNESLRKIGYRWWCMKIVHLAGMLR